jgi:hypothetical protein
MLKDFPFHVADLRALNHLAVDAAIGATDVVEHMHHNIARLPWVFGPASDRPARGISGLVYRSIRGITRTLGGGIDSTLGLLTPRASPKPASARREALLAALNGVIGDHLHDSGNPLRIAMRMRRQGQALELTRSALDRSIPQATGRIVVLAHGLCMSDLQWRRHGHDHGAALAADAGCTPVYLHYNSGLHISSNGRAFAEQLERLLQAWPVPVERLAIIGYSMGGLLARSACDHARRSGHAWLGALRDLIFLGTPHLGAPLERGGRHLEALLGASPYTSALSRLGKLRSAGITDLRHASLSDADWQDRDRFARGEDTPARRLALPRAVRCHAIAASLAKKPGSLGERVLGDGLVPLDSALGLHADRERQLGLRRQCQHIVYGTSHLGLLDSAEAHMMIRTWLAKPLAPRKARHSSGKIRIP